MYSFKLPTEIKMFETITEFVANTNITEQDLIITNAPIYEPLLKQYGLKGRIIFQENYGGGEPNDQMINAMIRDLSGYRYNRVIGVGGGTVIDVAKVLSLDGVENVLDALHGRVPLQRNRKLLIVPTTCGTGSEVTNIAILADTQADVKKGIVGPAMYPDEAVLVPELLKGLPYKFFAFSAIDALIHAIESYLAPTSNPFTEMFAVKAIVNIISTFQDINKYGPKTVAHNVGQVLISSTWAGIAFGNTGVGAVHAMSYPLGGKYHVPHGEANYAFLGTVLTQYDRLNPHGKISELKNLLAHSLGISDPGQAVESLDETLNKIIPLKRLEEYGVQEGEMQEFAEMAMAQERLMKNNYVPLTEQDILAMYMARY